MKKATALLVLLIVVQAAADVAAQQPFGLDTNFRTVIERQYVNSILPLADGDLIVSGSIRFPGDVNDRGGARLNADGTRDLAFANVAFMGGKLTPWNGRVYARNGNGVRRLWPDGTLDTDFILLNNGPYFNSLQGGDYHIYPDGRMAMTGVHFLSDTVRGFEGFYSLIWFSNTGYLDTTRTHRYCDGTVDRILEQPDGRFLLSGVLTTYEGQPAGRILRVMPDGALDPSFVTDFDWGYAQTISVLADDRIIASGYLLRAGMNDTLKVVRLLADGTLDQTFNNTLSVTHDALGSYLELQHFVLPDGRIVLLGQFDHVDGQPRGGLALLDADGNLLNDAFTGAGCGEVININLGSHVQGAVSMTSALDGSYYITGIWRGYDDGTVNDTTQRYVSRLYGLDVGIDTSPSATSAAFTMLPNPADAQVTFRLANEIEEAMISLRDIAGREIFKRSVGPSGSWTWDVSGVPPGTYVVALLDEGGVRGAQRLVVAR